MSREQTTPCVTCDGEARILAFFDRGPESPPGNHWIGCPDCEAGRAYDEKLRAEAEVGMGRRVVDHGR